jgi:hypothetical protein
MKELIDKDPTAPVGVYKIRVFKLTVCGGGFTLILYPSMKKLIKASFILYCSESLYHALSN